MKGNAIETSQIEAGCAREPFWETRFFDNCILGNKEKDTGSNIRPEGRTETSTLLENDTWENYGEH